MPSFPKDWSDLSVALSHDWLTGMRGGERVLEILCDGFPEAPILTLFHAPGAVSGTINGHEVRTSWLQALPGITERYRNLLPLFPYAVSRLHAPGTDLLISSSHCVAKGVRTDPSTRHLCYCFTPMRYAWLFFDEYVGRNAVKRALARPILRYLRNWDRRANAGVDRFVAISEHVRERIREFYGRDADVVYPPVDLDRCRPGAERPATFDLVVSALVPYKRVELVVRAYARSGYPLKIVGVGSEYAHLQSMAGSNVEFLGWCGDDDVLSLYQSCRMLIFPGEEDFGLVPVEAQACGCPVVAYGKGGVLESVSEGVSGVFFADQSEDALLEAVEHCAGTRWDSDAIRGSVERFGTQAFVDGMAESIRKCLRAG